MVLLTVCAFSRGAVVHRTAVQTSPNTAASRNRSAAVLGNTRRRPPPQVPVLPELNAILSIVPGLRPTLVIQVVCLFHLTSAHTARWFWPYLSYPDGNQPPQPRPCISPAQAQQYLPPRPYTQWRHSAVAEFSAKCAPLSLQRIQQHSVDAAAPYPLTARSGQPCPAGSHVCGGQP